MIVIPGITFAAHSFAASSALTPALPASILLKKTSATLHPPKTVPFASRRSTAMSSIGKTPGLGWKKGFFTAGALVSGSMIFERRTDLVFFPHRVLESDRKRGMAEYDDRCRGVWRICCQEGVRESKWEAGIGVIGVNDLAMAPF